jgi:hypothetical protein
VVATKHISNADLMLGSQLHPQLTTSPEGLLVVVSLQ